MKWEYKRLDLTQWDKCKFSKNTFIDENLLNFGNEGWELVSVDNGIAYFKRMIIGGSYDTARLQHEMFEAQVEKALQEKLK